MLTESYAPAAAIALTYTPDGSRLLVLDAAGGISVLDPTNLSQLSTWALGGPANSLACAPDGRTVAVAFGSWLEPETGWVECWSISEQRKIATYPASGAVGATRFTPDGRTLIIGCWDGLVTWRTLPEGEWIAERRLPKDVVAATAFSPDAAKLPLEAPPLPPDPVPLLDQPLAPTPSPQLIPEPGRVGRASGMKD
jgi:WD40 repeat protein